MTRINQVIMWRELAFMLDQLDSNCPKLGTTELVMEAIRQLPEDVSLEKISEEIAILAAIRRGEKAAEEGRLVPHNELKRRAASWTSQ
jgi:predicted transcriptional regulator